jgi:hypothetical protein
MRGMRAEQRPDLASRASLGEVLLRTGGYSGRRICGAAEGRGTAGAG